MTGEAQPAWPVWLPRHMLTAEEVAELLNVSVRSVRRLIKEDKLPIVRIGRAIRIKPEAVLALVQGQ